MLCRILLGGMLLHPVRSVIDCSQVGQTEHKGAKDLECVNFCKQVQDRCTDYACVEELFGAYGCHYKHTVVPTVSPKTSSSTLVTLMTATKAPSPLHTVAPTPVIAQNTSSKPTTPATSPLIRLPKKPTIFTPKPKLDVTLTRIQTSSPIISIPATTKTSSIQVTTHLAAKSHRVNGGTPSTDKRDTPQGSKKAAIAVGGASAGILGVAAAQGYKFMSNPGEGVDVDMGEGDELNNLIEDHNATVVSIT